jgi:hypothetical protein
MHKYIYHSKHTNVCILTICMIMMPRLTSFFIHAYIHTYIHTYKQKNGRTLADMPVVRPCLYVCKLQTH